MSIYSPLIEKTDIEQEAQVLILRGKTPNRGIIRMKLEREAITDLELDLDTWEERIDFILGIDESPQAQLVNWAQDFNEDVQSCIDDFLADPEALLQSTIEFLSRLDLLREKATSFVEVKPRPQISYASMMQKALPCTKNDLIALMSTYPIKRPASTVRQFLRRNAIHLQEDDLGRYHYHPIA